jgi:hypothetical protein
MGYGYTCEECGGDFPDEDPALMGEAHEEWFKTSDLAGRLAHDHDIRPGDVITLCGPCLLEMVER